MHDGRNNLRTMTQESSTQSAGRAVFLAALMILSIFAVPAAFAGSAAASASITGTGADDVTADQYTVEQNFTFDAQLASGASDDITVDFSDLPAEADVTAASASAAGNHDVSGGTLDNAAHTYDFTVTNNGASGATEEVTVTFTLDTTNAAPQTGLKHQISAATSGETTSVDYAITDPVQYSAALRQQAYTPTTGQYDTSNVSAGTVTVTDVNASEGDHLIITHTAGDGSETVVGLHQIADASKSQYAVDLGDASNVGTDHTAHIVQEGAASGTYAVGDTLSSTTANNAEVSDSGLIMGFDAQLSDQMYSSPTDTVTVDVSSLNPSSQDYVVAVVNTETNEVLGTTDVISGQQSDYDVTLDSKLNETTNIGFQFFYPATDGSDFGDPVMVSVTYNNAPIWGGAVSNIATATVSNYDKDISSSSESDPALVFLGQTVFTNSFNANEDVTIRKDTGDGSSEFVREVTANDNGEVTFDTSDLEEGLYYFEGETSGDVVYFEAVEATLDVNAEETNVSNLGPSAETTATLDTNRGDTNTYEVTAENSAGDAVSSDKLLEMLPNAERVDEETVAIDAAQADEIQFNFTNVEAGSYDLTFDSADTTASDSVAFNVEELEQGDIEFTQGVYSETRGDVASFEVGFSEAADTATVQFGDYEEDGYELVLLVEADEPGETVTVNLNTYALGQDDENMDVVTADGGSVTVLNSTNVANGDLLDAASYELRVAGDQHEGGVDDSDLLDLSVMTLQERDSLSAHTRIASVSNANTIANDGNVTVEGETRSTQSETVAMDDSVLLGFETTGLSGLIETKAGSNTAEQIQTALDDGSLELSVKQTEDSVNMNSEAKVLDTSATDYSVVNDGDTYYIIINTGDMVFEDGSSAEAGDAFNATLAITDERLLDPSGDENVEDLSEESELTTTFTVEERYVDFSFEGEELTLEAVENATVTVETNAAPGSEMTFRTQSSGDTKPPFLKSETTTVQPDGTLSATFDMSEQSEGDTFDVTLSGVAAPDDAKVSGSVASAEEEPESYDVTINVVDADGNPVDASVMVDGSSVDSETVSVEAGEHAFEASADGYTTTTQTTTVDSNTTVTLIIEEQTTETPTDNPNTATDEPASTATETDDPVTTTEGSTPGFGAVLALVAVLAAALLATRRD